MVAFEGTIREKPETPEQCHTYMKSYVDRPACTVTAVVVTHVQSGQRVSGVDIAKQWFKPVPAEVLDALIAKGDVMHCCGGFMVDDPLLAPYLDRREGDEDSIIGMPLTLTLKLLEQARAFK